MDSRIEKTYLTILMLLKSLSFLNLTYYPKQNYQNLLIGLLKYNSKAGRS